MKRAFALAVFLFLLLTSCVTVQQEQEEVEKEVAALNQEIEEREYARIVKWRDEEFAVFREKLAQATKAAVVRERGDCCCTGAELAPVNDEPLSQEEFREMMAILTQAEPVPVVSESTLHRAVRSMPIARMMARGSWTPGIISLLSANTPGQLITSS